MYPNLGPLPTGHTPAHQHTAGQSATDRLPLSSPQLPLGLPPTGDFAFVRETVRKDALDKWDALTQRIEIRLHQGRVWFPEAAQSDFTAGFLTPTTWATGQFCQRLGIPAAYFRKCPSVLQDLQFNHWITQDEGGKEDFETGVPATSQQPTVLRAAGCCGPKATPSGASCPAATPRSTTTASWTASPPCCPRASRWTGSRSRARAYICAWWTPAMPERPTGRRPDGGPPRRQ